MLLIVKVVFRKMKWEVKNLIKKVFCKGYDYGYFFLGWLLSDKFLLGYCIFEFL